MSNLNVLFYNSCEPEALVDIDEEFLDTNGERWSVNKMIKHDIYECKVDSVITNSGTFDVHVKLKQQTPTLLRMTMIMNGESIRSYKLSHDVYRNIILRDPQPFIVEYNGKELSSDEIDLFLHCSIRDLLMVDLLDTPSGYRFRLDEPLMYGPILAYVNSVDISVIVYKQTKRIIVNNGNKLVRGSINADYSSLQFSDFVDKYYKMPSTKSARKI